MKQTMRSYMSDLIEYSTEKYGVSEQRAVHHTRTRERLVGALVKPEDITEMQVIVKPNNKLPTTGEELMSAFRCN